jgi:hypothetical protein
MRLQVFISPYATKLTVLELCVERTSKSADRAIATLSPIGSFPFSAEVGVGPDSALRVLEVLYLLVFTFVSSLVNSSCLSPCRIFYLYRSVTFEETHFGTNSDTSRLATNAQPPPEGEVEDSDLSAAADCASTCSDASKQVPIARHGRSRHRPILTMAHRLDLTRRSIRTVVSNEASKIAIYR